MKETTRLDQPEGDRHRAVIEESTDASCQPQTEDSAEANGMCVFCIQRKQMVIVSVCVPIRQSYSVEFES